MCNVPGGTLQLHGDDGLVCVSFIFRFYNRLIEDNEQQESAVRHIVAGSSRPAPFLIFGPPGTGKTMTMVEAMKQVNQVI